MFIDKLAYYFYFRFVYVRTIRSFFRTFFSKYERTSSSISVPEDKLVFVLASLSYQDYLLKAVSIYNGFNG